MNPLELGENNPQNLLRDFYLKALPVLKDDIKSRFPIGDGEKSDVYEKAVAARVEALRAVRCNLLQPGQPPRDETHPPPGQPAGGRPISR